MNKNLINELNKYKIKISKIDLTVNNFKIESEDGKIFVAPIKKGSVECRIFNESNQEVNLGSIIENTLVTIIGLKINDMSILDKEKLYKILVNDLTHKKTKNIEKNIIVIKKIIVKNNYVFNSDSSDELNEFD